MAYAWDTFYYFQSHRGTSNLYLNREGSGAVAPNQNISIYKKVGTGANPDHQFKLVRAYDSNGGVAGCTIRSALGSNYALNIYGYGTDMSAEGNCDLYPVGGQYPGSSNYDDSLIDLLTVNADENLYKITLINHQGLYLTPESKSTPTLSGQNLPARTRMSGSFARVKRAVAVVPLEESKFRLTCARRTILRPGLSIMVVR